MIRGLHTHNGVLHAVQDDTLYSVDSNGDRTTLGTLASTAGPLEFASLVSQLVITDGAVLYVWDGTTVTQVSGYPFGNTIGFIDQRLVFDYLNAQQFGWSELNNAKVLEADFFSAESSPDPLVGLATGHGEIWLFGTQTTEVWRSVGGEDLYERSGNVIEYGCAAPHTIRKGANSFVWLSTDRNGQARVLLASGYQPSRISTRAIEERFNGRDLSGATAFIYSDGPHEFYCLNVPGVETTLVYDFAYQQWHERAEVGPEGEWVKWRPTCHAFAYGKHFFGADDDVIYQMDHNAHTYGSDPKVRSRVVPVISNDNRARLTFPELEILCQKATNASIMIRWSDDGGNKFGNWHIVNSGATGKYVQRIVKRMLGSSRDRVFEIRCADDAPFNPVSMHVQVT